MNAIGAQSVTVSVPGKIILAGEYDVLRGGTALAATVSPRLSVTLSVAREHAGSSIINSDLWAEPRYLRRDDPISFYGHDDMLTSAVAAAMKTWNLPDLDVSVCSGFEVTSGFGSSSALRLAVLTAGKVLAHPKLKSDHPGETLLDCARLAYSLQKVAQSGASGYDIVTQLLGGAVEFRCDTHSPSDQWPLQADVLPATSLKFLNDYVHVLIGGAGAPTKKLMQTTMQWLDENDPSSQRSSVGHQRSDSSPMGFPTRRWDALHTLSSTLVDALRELMAGNDSGLHLVIQSAALIRRFFASSPAFPKVVGDTLATVPGLDINWTWKTTGAGGEDAILLFGDRSNTAAAKAELLRLGWRYLENPFSGRSLCVDKIVNSESLH